MAIHILLAGFYSLTSLILGWWGNPFITIPNTFKAITTNIEGGLDITQSVENDTYDDLTNYVWDNLYRETTQKITKDQLEIILEIHSTYASENSLLFDDKHIQFIASETRSIEMNHITKHVIDDIFSALQLIEN